MPDRFAHPAVSAAVRLCAALCAAVLAISLLPQMASAETAISPRITPPQGSTAVKVNDVVTVSGTAPAGDIQGGRWVGLDEDGNEVATTNLSSSTYDLSYDAVRFGVVGLTPNPFVRNDDGTLTGQLKLPSMFADPNQEEPGVHPCTDGCVRQAVLELNINGQSGPSNALRVDYTRPTIERYELVGTDLIRVVFSEPVRMRDGQKDLASDWTIHEPAGTVVSSVQGGTEGDCQHSSNRDPSAGTTGCTRVLKLGQHIGEDAQPIVEYTNSLSSIPDRIPYIDGANNRLIGVLDVRHTAADRVRPAAPHIQTIDGKTPAGGVVTSNNNTPVVLVTNLVEGHTLELRLEPDGQAVRTYTYSVPPTTNALAVTLPALQADTGYNLTAAAIDGAGNRSDDDSKVGPANRADGARPSARYVLDRVAPQVLSARLTDTFTVAVDFSEPVLPDGDAGQWFVGDIPVTASGAGDTRTLKADISLANPGHLRWQPTSGEAGSTGSYGDRAGNAMAALHGLSLADLPAVGAPRVTTPTSNTFTRAGQVTIRGTAEDRANRVAELFTRGSETVAASAPVQDGRWAITISLPRDVRYEHEVRIRDTKTGVISQRARVADVVRDTVAPQVTVHEPAAKLLTTSLPEYGVGDAVTVEWTATDTANDPKLPDHGRSARVILVSSKGTRTAVSGALDHQPGQRQTFTYTLKDSDLEGAGFNDLHFEVVVDDLAGNVGSELSGTIRLLASLIGYQPVLTALATGGQASVIEARFPVALTGSMAPGDWTVDGVIAAAELSGDRRIVRLTAILADDPNATPGVRYYPTLPMEHRLQAENGRQVSTGERRAIDRLKPALTVQVPNTPRTIGARTVTFSGTTDKTARPNTVAAFKSTAAGARTGSAIAKTVAGTDGTWQLRVPLDPNGLNRIVVQAVDPSSNRSQVLPSSPYTVVEDSLAPVVRLRAPNRAGLVGTIVRIRWATAEANKSFAQIQYRPRNGGWATIAGRTTDDGFYKWGLPKQLNGQVFELRVRSVDQTGKAGGAAVQGLRADLKAPVLYRARTLGPRKVRLFFNERMNMTRAGFTVDGIPARRVASRGSKQTLLLRRSLSRTTPTVVYRGTRARDLAGNRLPARNLTADRAFVFSVTHVDADRLSGRTVRVTWRDARNKSAHIKHYRIYRNGKRIGTVGWSVRSFKDRTARGSYRYVVRAVDNQRRISSGSGDRVR